MTKNEKKVVSQKELIAQLSKVRSAINLKINEIVAGDVNKEKKTIEGGLDVYSALKNNLIAESQMPSGRTDKDLAKWFKTVLIGTLAGQSWEFFTKPVMKKTDLEKLPVDQAEKETEKQLYKVGTKKGRAFINFARIGWTAFTLDMLYKNVTDKSGRLYIKLDAVETLFKKKQQSFWKLKLDSQDDYSKFTFQDMLRAYSTMFGKKRTSRSNSKLYNLILEIVNECSQDFEEHILKNYQDCFVPSATFQNKSAIYYAIEKLSDIMVGRAEWTTTGKGGKDISDKVSLDLVKEYDQMQNALDGNVPVVSDSCSVVSNKNQINN